MVIFIIIISIVIKLTFWFQLLYNFLLYYLIPSIPFLLFLPFFSYYYSSSSFYSSVSYLFYHPIIHLSHHLFLIIYQIIILLLINKLIIFTYYMYIYSSNLTNDERKSILRHIFQFCIIFFNVMQKSTFSLFLFLSKFYKIKF